MGQHISRTDFEWTEDQEPHAPIRNPCNLSSNQTAVWKYHLEYHRYQGDDELDSDIPTSLEAKLLSTTGGKLLWLILHSLFYALRPVFTRPRSPTKLELFNTVLQLSFNFAVFYFLDVKSFLYMLGYSLLAMGVHPVAGHFISELYMF
ncbi:hypothetical protein QYM36_000735 [Artemia franciscana]|uniref:Uncharacterized protein n=1 Tax=Artemia franciscana TaxID=6661 RepID=A0AA88IRI8_ARTSF|nr:hypothetical protein QYM36_000735 [Artemia franciscana]